MLKLSRYTFLFRKGDSFFIYNSRTNSFFETDDASYRHLIQIKENGIDTDEDDEEIRDLRRRKIVVSPEEDDLYLDYLRLSYFKSAYSSDNLGLTILPTIGCNLRCPYCFEESKPTGLMSDEIIENLISFIKKNAVNKKYTITWFGGEPLLGISVIEKILDKLSLSQEGFLNGMLSCRKELHMSHALPAMDRYSEVIS